MKVVELSREARLERARNVLADWRASRDSEAADATADAGSHILAHIERELGHGLLCGTCRQYLTTLNTARAHDANAIIAKLMESLPVPPHITAIHNTPQKLSEWLRDIVTTALLAWVDSAAIATTANDGAVVNSS